MTRVLFFEHKTIWGGGQITLHALLNAALDHPQDEIEPLLVCPPKAALLARVRGLPIYTFDLGRIQKHGHWLANLSQRIAPTLKLIRVLRRERVEVIIANGAYSFLASVGAAKLTRTPIIWWEHNTTLPRGAILRGMIRAADRIITVAEIVRQQFVSLELIGLPKISTIHNGVKSECYDANQINAQKIRAEFGIEPNALVVGNVGRFAPEKGQELLIDAVARIQSRLPNVRFLLVGEGPLRADLEKRALGLDVIFTAWREDIADLLQVMDVFVLPSRAEALPMALLEAMASGKSIVAADVGGVREVVMDGETGFLFPPNDVDAMTRWVETLLNDAILRAQMGARGRARVLAEFTFDQTWRKMVEVMRNMRRATG